MGLLGYIILLLIIGGLVWLIFWGPDGLTLIAVAVIISLFLGAFLWETLIDPGPARFWPSRVAVVRPVPTTPSPAPTEATGEITNVPSTLLSDEGKEVGGGEGFTLYLYDDSWTTGLDLIVETEGTVTGITYNGISEEPLDHYVDGSGTGYWYFEVDEVSVGDTVVVNR